MSQNLIYRGVTAIASRLQTNERRARHLIEQELIRTFYLGKNRATTEAMIEADIRALEIRSARAPEMETA